MTKIWITLLSIALFLSMPLLVFTSKKQQNIQADKTVQTSEIAAQLLKDKRSIDFESGELKGEGADFLAREASAAQFFLIGEIHGIAEVPLFTQALLQQIQQTGFENLVIETGHLTARELENLAKKKNAPQAFANFDREFPFAIPFYNMKEETAMLESFLKNGRARKNRLWGLDYEFILSSEMHLKRLMELAPDAEARKIVETYYHQSSNEFEHLIQTKNPAALFVITAKKKDWEKLQAALKPKEDSEAAEILKSLKTAQEIFLKKFAFGQVFESNLQRVELMKKQFMRYYNAAARNEKLPKVIIKFGAIHTKRGRSYENLFDIGSLAANLADANGTKSFHLLILPVKGTVNLYRPFTNVESDKNKLLENALKPDESADISPFLSLAENETKPFLLDLRTLRPMLDAKKFSNIDRGFEEIIWGYDAVLILPQVTASTLLN